MAEIVRLTVVPIVEAHVVCAMLRANGIVCADRPADLAAQVGGFGQWTEILVSKDDLDQARALPEAKPVW